MALLVLLVPGNSLAQLLPFTQYYNTPSLLNSSLTGLNRGTRFQLIQRDHWISTDQKYTTAGMAYELNFKDNQHSGGLAFHALNDGIGYDRYQNRSMSRNNLGVSFAYHSLIQNEDKRKRYLSGGVGIEVFQMSMNWERYTFSDQVHPIFGRHVGWPTEAHAPDESYFSPSVSFGTNYIQNKLITEIFDIATDDYFEVGLAYVSPITVREGFFDAEVFQKRRLTAHFRSELMFNKLSELNNRLGITGRFDMTQGRSEMTFNAYMINWNIIGGAGLQAPIIGNPDYPEVWRMHFTTGYIVNQLKDHLLYISYTYSAAISGISNNRLGNNQEISLVMQFTRKGFKYSEGIRMDGFF